jgi:DNA modification methylase
MRIQNFADIKAIKIPPNRQRTEFDEGELRELSESIQARGLLHAIVLREDAGNLFLVSGERRLRAIEDLWALGGQFKYDGFYVPEGTVPFNNLRELSPLEAMEAEFEENVRRTDLSWQDRAKATKALETLRGEQAKAKGLPPPSLASIAKEVRGATSGSPIGDTKMELILAGHLNDPDIAKAPTLREAFKVAQRKEVARQNAELGELVGRAFTSAVHKIYNEDVTEWVKEQADEQFDVILTDPPYGMGADEFGDSGGMAAGGHGYGDDPVTFYELFYTAAADGHGMLEHFFRLAKPEAHLYLFCDVDKFGFLKGQAEEAGWKVFRTPLIWHKPTAARAPWPEQGPQRKYETILYAVKGGMKVNKMAGDVLTYMPDENLGNAAQKPVSLFTDLLSRSVRPGGRVLDAFCGSGPIFPAAHLLKVAAVGVEKDVASYGIALKRLEGLK